MNVNYGTSISQRNLNGRLSFDVLGPLIYKCKPMIKRVPQITFLWQQNYFWCFPDAQKLKRLPWIHI